MEALPVSLLAFQPQQYTFPETPHARAPEARRAIRRAGYELGFSNGTGQSNVLQFDPLDVRRLSLEVDLSDAYFRGMVAMPYFAYEPNHA